MGMENEIGSLNFWFSQKRLWQAGKHPGENAQDDEQAWKPVTQRTISYRNRVTFTILKISMCFTQAMECQSGGNL